MNSDVQYVYRTHPRARSVSISIRDGAVVVTSPRFVPRMFVQAFVKRSEAWISQHLEKARGAFEKKQSMRKKNTVLFLGNEYQVTVDETRPRGITVEETTLYVHPVNRTETSVQRAIERWYSAQAESLITRLAHELAKRMDVSFENIRFRTQKTRWGSCSIRGTLSFNRKLIGAPREVIEYVIIHELTHITHMNHGKTFWERVAMFDPLHKTHKKWLRTHGVLL